MRLFRKLPRPGVDACYTAMSKRTPILETAKTRNLHSLVTSTFICGRPACVTTRGTPHSLKGASYNKVKSSFFFWAGPFRDGLARPISAPLASDDGEPTGDPPVAKSCPRPLPVARTARSQSRRNRVSFAGRPSNFMGPRRRRETRSATEISSSNRSSVYPIHLPYE